MMDFPLIYYINATKIDLNDGFTRIFYVLKLCTLSLPLILSMYVCMYVCVYIYKFINIIRSTWSQLL